MKTFVSALGFGKAPCRLDVEFDSGSDSSAVPSSSGRDRGSGVVPVPVFTSNDTVKGRVQVIPLSLKRVEHLGIRVQLVGEVVLKSDKHRPHEFLSMVQDVAPPGDISAIHAMPFCFEHVKMPYESYSGSQVSLRYSVRVFMARSMGQTMIRDHFFDVRNPTSDILACHPVANGIVNDGDKQEPEGDQAQVETQEQQDATFETNGTTSGHPDTNENQPGKIKMEVGIEDCLHIEFEYGKNVYSLQDVVIGRINFMLVRIKLKHMELEIKRRETVGSGIDARLESTTVAKYEIMDGAPAKGESIPIRMYLSPYPLTPSYENIEGKFSVKYSLNLVLVDEEDRRYFKQHEISLYRLADGAPGTVPAWNLITSVNRVNRANTKREGEQHEGPADLKVVDGADGQVVDTVQEADDGFSQIPL